MKLHFITLPHNFWEILEESIPDLLCRLISMLVTFNLTLSVFIRIIFLRTTRLQKLKGSHASGPPANVFLCVFSPLFKYDVVFQEHLEDYICEDNIIDMIEVIVV